jgi:hypothetical protein
LDILSIVSEKGWVLRCNDSRSLSEGREFSKVAVAAHEFNFFCSHSSRKTVTAPSFGTVCGILNAPEVLLPFPIGSAKPSFRTNFEKGLGERNALFVSPLEHDRSEFLSVVARLILTFPKYVTRHM